VAISSGKSVYGLPDVEPSIVYDWGEMVAPASDRWG